LLRMDPTAVARPLVASARRLLQHSLTSESSSCGSYAYPLNLAIHSKAQPPVLLALFHAAPHVAGLPDGHCMETSMHILLKRDFVCEATAATATMVLL